MRNGKDIKSTKNNSVFQLLIRKHLLEQDYKSLKELTIEISRSHLKGKNIFTTPILRDVILAGTLEILQNMLNSGANINSLKPEVMTLLHYSLTTKSPKIAEFLIKAGANLNAQDHLGRTPLHYVAVSNNKAILEALLKNGADSSIKNNKERTALDEAKTFANTAAIDLLENYLPANGSLLNCEEVTFTGDNESGLELIE